MKRQTMILVAVGAAALGYAYFCGPLESAERYVRRVYREELGRDPGVSVPGHAAEGRNNTSGWYSFVTNLLSGKTTREKVREQVHISKEAVGYRGRTGFLDRPTPGNLLYGLFGVA